MFSLLVLLIYSMEQFIKDITNNKHSSDFITSGKADKKMELIPVCASI